jgi:hypothetical protein
MPVDDCFFSAMHVHNVGRAISSQAPCFLFRNDSKFVILCRIDTQQTNISIHCSHNVPTSTTFAFLEGTRYECSHPFCDLGIIFVSKFVRTSHSEYYYNANDSERT